MAKDQSIQAVTTQAQRTNPTVETSVVSCSNCHHMTDADASFCEECGNALQIKSTCPFCGVQMFGKKNICEFCGEWLLLGKCRYCEGDVEDGQLFCGNCGNLLNNIQCPGCGEKSAFDICLNCGTILTPSAKELLIECDTKLGFFGEYNSLSIKETPLASSRIEDQLKLKQYKEAFNYNNTTSIKSLPIGGLFNNEQRNRIQNLANEAEIEQKRQEEERLRIEEEERKRQEELRRAALLARAEGTLYVKNLNVIITIKNEDGIADDRFWLWVNNNKIGYIGYNVGGRVSYPASFVKGINFVELRFDKASGVGTVASIAIEPDGQERRYGGSSSHLWMVVT